MRFSHKYFDDEIREDFYVSGIMKRLWAANLEVISDIAEVCEKHNIRWFADYGTLLGAVRHGGCIPWDDDFDICMLRDDYMRFLAVAERELPDNYSVLSSHNEYEDLLIRVTNMRHPTFDDDILEKYHQCYLGAGVDIFPLDYMAPTKEEQEAHKTLIQAVLSFQPILEDKELDREVLDEVLDQLEQLCGVKFDRDGKLVKQMYEAAESVCALYGPEDADTVMLAPIWANNGTKSYPLSCFQNAIKVNFEGIGIWISAEYDTMLRIEYGDYMRIVKGGASHGYPSFAEQEAYVREHLPEYPFEYKFDMKDLECQNRLPKKRAKEESLRFAELMRNAHNQIGRALMSGKEDIAFSLFQSCQNAAIGIGTMLEEQYGQGYPLVSILEQYCEAIYQASEHVDQYVADSLCDGLDKLIHYFESQVQEQMEDKKEIVILPYRASSWKNIESIWRQAMEDRTCNVTVLMPPYYEKNALGGFGTMHDESGMLPDYVEVTAYDSYDFEGKHPDVIYTQNPYDECNYTSSVHPFFYVRNLKKFTDKLIYIPWFTMKDINLANGKVYQTMKYFCTVPGVVLADEVMLPSDAVRDAYIERLTEFAGETTRNVWEKKIVVKDVPVCVPESANVYDRLPDAWKNVFKKTDGSRKPIVLYDISAASFAQGKEHAIKKLSNTLAFFEEKKDEIAFILRKNSITEDALSVTDLSLYNRYKRIVDEYKEKQWGIYDDYLSYQDEVLVADAYYGDSGYIPRRFEMLGKPVLLQKIEIENTLETVPIVQMKKNDAGDYPFHIRAYTIVGELMYFIPDEMNLLCTMRLKDGDINILGSVPNEKINLIGLALKLEYYDGKIIVVPYMAKVPWIYDIGKKSWTKIRIRNQEQAWKFGTSEVYGDKLYMFPFHYKYITCIDLKDYCVTYLENIYRDFSEFHVDENCILRPCHVRERNIVYMVNHHSNFVLKFDLKTADYEWIRVGNRARTFAAIAWDGTYFYLTPMTRDKVLQWDGKDGYEEYGLPDDCKYDVNGPINANVIETNLILQGYKCDTIVYDLKDMSSVHSEPIRYSYAYKLREDFYTGHDMETEEFVIQDGKQRSRYSCIFPKLKLEEYIDGAIKSRQIGSFSETLGEDDIINTGYLVRCLSGQSGCKYNDLEKKTIVFLPYKASMWDSLESIWFAAKEDMRCETYVVPIPYYDKNAKGTLTEYHYEGDAFPDYVPVTDYRAFDLATKKIDVIYIHNPYDDGNYVTSVDPAYYSSELKKYADKLVYVPYYATAGGMSEAQSLCKAYLHADYIVVQAEEHKDFFDPIIPREKLLALGSPKFDRVVKLCQNPPIPPQEWLDKMIGKKVYFFNTSLGGMLADTEAFLKKLQYVFDCFEGREDVCLLWRPHPLLDTTFATTRINYKEDFDALKTYYIEKEIGIYDTTPDIDRTVALCDAYIGDSGTSVTALFGIVGKPVYILNNSIHRSPKESDCKNEMVTPFFQQGQDDWKVTPGNQLYRRCYTEKSIADFVGQHDVERRYCYEYYCDLSEYTSGGYYRLAIQRNDKVYVFPENAQEILVIDEDRNIERISLEQTTSQPGAFANIWFYERYAFLIPYKYRYIVRFDMDSKTVDYVDGCRDFIVSGQPGNDRVGGSCIWNGYLFVASPTDSQVIAIDCETLSLQILYVDAKYYRGACVLQADKEDVWLLPSTGTNVVRWTPKTGDTKIYNCRVSGFTCHSRPTGKPCMERAFGSLAVCADTVILAPLWGNQFVRIDKVNGQVSIFSTEIDISYEKESSYCASGGCGGFVRMLDEAYALFYHEDRRKLYKLNLLDGTTKQLEIDFDTEEIKAHAPGFNRCSKWLRYGYEECAIYSLEQFLEDMGTRKTFDREACLAAYREIAVHADGSSGKVIHDFVMSRL